MSSIKKGRSARQQINRSIITFPLQINCSSRQSIQVGSLSQQVQSSSFVVFTHSYILYIHILYMCVCVCDISVCFKNYQDKLVPSFYYIDRAVVTQNQNDLHK